MKELEELRRMIEHPQDYTDEAIQQMLERPDMREYYELMVSAENGFIQRKQRRRRSKKVWRVAAVTIGVIVLTGITFATIYNSGSRVEQQIPVAQETATGALRRQQTGTALQDSIRIYENVILEDILSELADYYHVSVEYHNDQARHVRLYMKWDKTSSLTQMIERLNTFEKICIRQKNSQLIVE